MKIAFDYQIFSFQHYGGVSRYFARLAQELSTKGEDIRVVAPLHQNHYLADLPDGNVLGRKILWQPPKSGRVLKIMNRCLSWSAMMRFGPDVIHETYYNHTPVLATGAARILTVYDMIHERFSSSFPDRDNTSQLKRIAVERADHIICISNSTKRDLCDIFNFPQEKVSVVHLGFEFFPMGDASTPTSMHDRPFLLFVGKRNGYKNFEGMLRAVSSRQELKNNFNIVAFGGNTFNPSELALIQSLNLRPGSVQQINGDDEILGGLYRSASAFVYPSLYEGFGLPPLEAMAHGCPVITSDTSSMPEVVGQAGESFNPSEIDAQAQAICNVVFDTTHRDALIEKGNERIDHFSWSKCAEETLKIYERF